MYSDLKYLVILLRFYFKSLHTSIVFIVVSFLFDHQDDLQPAASETNWESVTSPVLVTTVQFFFLESESLMYQKVLLCETCLPKSVPEAYSVSVKFLSKRVCSIEEVSVSFLWKEGQLDNML